MKECLLNTVSILSGLAPLIISIVAIYLTFRYQNHSKKMVNDKMLKELFTEFNQRYDKINNTLQKASKNKLEDCKDLNTPVLDPYYSAIIDFFNLCAEEYYWYQEGRIDDKIWNSWFKGMNDIFNSSPAIQSLWKEECENKGYKSYYIDKPNEFFSSYKHDKLV